MAELAVKVPYRSKTRSALLLALRITFPIWGLFAPIAGVILFAILISMIVHSGPSNDIWQGFAWAFTGMVAGLSGLLTTRSLSVDCITADKNGLQMPFALENMHGYIPWSNIRQIRVSNSSADDYRRQSLCYITDKGKAIPIKLSRLSDNEIEQLLLATEMWAPCCERDVSVEALQASLKKAIPSNASFTDMWEDELRRRFCATAFMPLEPGVHLRNGSLKVIRQLALGGLSALYLCQLQDKQLVVIKEAVVPEDSTESVRNKAR